MGDSTGHGDADEWPATIVDIERDFWIGRTEITNAQMRSLLPEHCSGYFTKRQIDKDGPGIELDTPNQPAIRVSWQEAMEFCSRLSARIQRRVTLPTEAQWEYAARAGTFSDMSYGRASDDFADHANMADRSLACLYGGTAGVAVLQPIPSIMQVDDQAIGTADVGSYAPNPWGLFDMHGNAAEWTRSLYHAYPYQPTSREQAWDGRHENQRFVVRGGSYYDRPHRCRTSHRQNFPAWQAVHDVGFRVVIEID
jgi:formylglycine-generating enzyme required for sulfatase activity